MSKGRNIDIKAQEKNEIVLWCCGFNWSLWLISDRMWHASTQRIPISLLLGWWNTSERLIICATYEQRKKWHQSTGDEEISDYNITDSTEACHVWSHTECGDAWSTDKIPVSLLLGDEILVREYWVLWAKEEMARERQIRDHMQRPHLRLHTRAYLTLLLTGWWHPGERVVGAMGKGRVATKPRGRRNLGLQYDYFWARNFWWESTGCYDLSNDQVTKWYWKNMWLLSHYCWVMKYWWQRNGCYNRRKKHWHQMQRGWGD